MKKNLSLKLCILSIFVLSAWVGCSNPSSSMPGTPGASGNPKSSVVPVSPGVPVSSGTPAGSGAPGASGNPKSPDAPVSPVAPGTPVSPSAPGTPEIPVSPSVPEIPGGPVASGLPTTSIIITDAPAELTYHSLLLFKREATIENDPSSPSKLKNMVAKGSVLAAGNGTIVFSVFPRIPETDYVLVLEASSGTERTNRRMFITGTGSSRGTTFITGDVSFSRFLSNNKTGYKPDELVVKFGKF